MLPFLTVVHGHELCGNWIYWRLSLLCRALLWHCWLFLLLASRMHSRRKRMTFNIFVEIRWNKCYAPFFNAVFSDRCPWSLSHGTNEHIEDYNYFAEHFFDTVDYSCFWLLASLVVSDAAMTHSRRKRNDFSCGEVSVSWAGLNSSQYHPWSPCL